MNFQHRSNRHLPKKLPDISITNGNLSAKPSNKFINFMSKKYQEKIKLISEERANQNIASRALSSELKDPFALE